MFMGRYYLGHEVPIRVLTVNAARTPTAPDRCPDLEVCDDQGGKVATGVLLPAVDRPAQTGYFQVRVRLDGRFTAGRYEAVVRYEAGNYQGQVVRPFDVVAGGSTDGAVLAMASFERPHARLVVAQLDSGRLVKKTNPGA
jgi:hypothetical protein